MAKYARGKKSQAISDRGGLKVPYTDLMTTWDGLRVSPDDWEPKQPQLTPAKNVVDATALFNPRPDNDPENAEVFIGYNFDIFTPVQDRPPVGVHGLGVVSHGSVIEMDVSVTGVAGTGAVGTVYPNPAINAAAGTGAIGTEVPEAEIKETGVAGTGAVNLQVIESILNPTGVAGTGAIGTETAVSEIDVSGVAGTGSVHVIGTGAGSDFNLIVGPVTGLGGVGTTGNEEAVAEISETGLAGTGAIGSVDLAVGWGNNAWGNGTWGNGL